MSIITGVHDPFVRFADTSPSRTPRWGARKTNAGPRDRRFHLDPERPCLKMAAFAQTLSAAMNNLRITLLAIAFLLPTAAQAQRVDPVHIEDRFNQLQQSITLLTGQIEQLQYRNQQLQQQLEKMQADYEYRLDQMEKGKGGGGPRPGGAQAAAPGPGPGPAPTPAAPPPAGAANAGGDQMYNDAM